MAQVYKRAKGYQMEKLIALHRDVQDDMADRALKAGTEAEANLAFHRRTGDAHIEVESGKLDYYVALEASGKGDSGFAAAWNIEFGRPGGVGADGTPTGRMRGLQILRETSFGEGIWAEGQYVE